jgi:hypothetical protein
MTGDISGENSRRQNSWISADLAFALGMTSADIRPQTDSRRTWTPNEIVGLAARASILRDEKVRSYHRGTIILSAAIMAMEEGAPLKLKEIHDRSSLGREAVIRGTSFLEERGLVVREVDPEDRLQTLRADEPLLFAAANLDQYPLLRDAMFEITGSI